MKAIQIPASNAFANAIKRGTLTDNPTHSHYAGNYMYMHSVHLTHGDRKDSFKHFWTGEYVHCFG